MSTSKHIDKICCIVLICVIALTAVFVNADQFGVTAVSASMGYEQRLFDTTRVHTIDIVMDDWEGFLETCENEEYELCSVVIDNEAYKNVGIRAKGNTSLSMVSQYGNDRYSFKVEFDHYDHTKTYYGLDKLSLNNIIQDYTYMKDYLSYQMMGYFGVSAPLCSYVYITVNGEEWGLYLAVEGVEESFLERNYGSDYGQLYKPDSTNMGGGRGNGGGFDMDRFREDQPLEGEPENEVESPAGGNAENGIESPAEGNAENGMESPAGGNTENGIEPPAGGNAENGMEPPTKINFENGVEPPAGMESENRMEQPPQMHGQAGGTENSTQPSTGAGTQDRMDATEERPQGKAKDRKLFDGFAGHEMGDRKNDDVSLVYTDDDPDSYSNIFDNAKTDLSDTDKERLIASLKAMNEGTDLAEVVNIDEVIRYFVVHNFVCNFDSYTGSMIHNYYLYEENGQMSMIPWDYNLAFGGFQSQTDATGLVNYPIDTPVSGGDTDSRPMLAWILNNETYTEQYHAYFSEFISSYFESSNFAEMIDTVSAMIAPYVEKDPTKFCTYDQFETGAAALKEFCLLRAESIRGQLEGTIPSTEEEQKQDQSSLVDGSSITISDMGSMGHEMGGRPGQENERGGRPGQENEQVDGSGQENGQGGGLGQENEQGGGSGQENGQGGGLSQENEQGGGLSQENEQGGGSEQENGQGGGLGQENEQNDRPEQVNEAGSWGDQEKL